MLSIASIITTSSKGFQRSFTVHPVLFHIGTLSVYSYGVMIALGAIAGVGYMAFQGKRDVGLTFDQANSLFLLIFTAAFIGGKVFLFLEDPSNYWRHPARLFQGQGFVFYGSFLFAIPTMFLFFQKNNLNSSKMLDVMAITTCIVHVFGRIGCFLAGCCYGTVTNSVFGVIFSDPACSADPKNAPLHPTQLYEASFIFLLLLLLLVVRRRRRFYGQLFLLYLISYAAGRSVIEVFRGDSVRGFIIDGWCSYAQFVALVIIIVSLYVYSRWSKRNKTDSVLPADVINK